MHSAREPPLTGVATPHVAVVLAVARERARVATGGEHPATRFGAASFLNLIKVGLETNLGYHLWMATALQLDSVANLEIARTALHHAADDALPQLGLLHQQLRVAQDVHSLCFRKRWKPLLRRKDKG